MIWPFNKHRQQTNQSPSGAAANIPREFWDETGRIFSLAFDPGVPLNVRKLALLDIVICYAEDSINKTSTDPNIEYDARIRLFLVLDLFSEENKARQQLSLAIKVANAASLRNHQGTVDDLNEFAKLLEERNQTSEAVVLLNAALRFGIASMGSDFSGKANLNANLANTLFRAGRYREAELIRLEERQLRLRHSTELEWGQLLLCDEGLADAILAQGRDEEARAIYEAVHRECQRFMPGESPGIQRLCQKLQSCNPTSG